jgi:hypothetical protein
MASYDAYRGIGSTGRLFASVPDVAPEVALLRTRLSFPDETFSVIVRPLLMALSAEGGDALPSRFGPLLLRSIWFAPGVLAVRRDRVLPPNVPPELLGDLAPLWTYAVFVAAMLRPERGAGSEASARLFDVLIPEVGRRWLGEDPGVSVALAEVLAGRACSDNPIEAILAEAAIGSAAEGASDRGVRSQTPVDEADGSRVNSSPFPFSASDFFSWLCDGTAVGSIEINEAGALLHRVPDGLLLVWPDAFQAFLASQGVPVSGRALKRLRQSVFETGWHLCGAGGIVVHNYGWRVGSGAGDTVSGIVIVEAGRLLDPLPPLNPGLTRIERTANSAP